MTNELHADDGAPTGVSVVGVSSSPNMNGDRSQFHEEDRRYGSPPPGHTEEEDQDEDRENDPIPYADLGRGLKPGSGPAKDLLIDGQIVTVVGEEGDGKSTFGAQVGCQLAAGQNIGGHFEVPEPVAPVLIVDVEQSEEDVAIIRNDMVDRGLSIDGVFWLSANGRSFDIYDDQKWLTGHVRELGPRVLMLDTGTESVKDPSDSISVKPLFIYLNRLLKNEGIRTVLMLAQPRKRSQEAIGARKFDDLFGSRVWKGRSSVAIYLEQHQITVWKQRGSYIKRRWGVADRYPIGRLERHDDGPTLIHEPQPAAEVEDERRVQITVEVGTFPGKYSKSSLIEDGLKIPGRSRAPWRQSVDDMLDEGFLETVGQYHRLQLTTIQGKPMEDVFKTDPDKPKPLRSTTKKRTKS